MREGKTHGAARFRRSRPFGSVTRLQGVPLAADVCRVGPLRIVLVAPPYFDVPPTGYGGVEAVVADLADALVDRGHQVTLLGAGSAGTAARFVPLWVARCPTGSANPYPEVMHALKVRRTVRASPRPTVSTSSTTIPLRAR